MKLRKGYDYISGTQRVKNTGNAFCGYIINEGGTKVVDFNTGGCWIRIAFYFNTFGHFYFNIGLLKYKPYFLFKFRKFHKPYWIM